MIEAKTERAWVKCESDSPIGGQTAANFSVRPSYLVLDLLGDTCRSLVHPSQLAPPSNFYAFVGVCCHPAVAP